MKSLMLPFLFCCVTLACQEPLGSAAQDAPRGTTKVVGTVVYIDLEGGFWAVKGDDGVTYDPVDGLPAAFRKQNLRVSMVVRMRPDLVGTHQVGPLVEIVQIEAI